MIPQTLIPNQMLGRAGASIRLAARSCMPIGYVAGGAIAQAFGAVLVFGLSGLIRWTNVGIALKMPKNMTENEEVENHKKAELH